MDFIISNIGAFLTIPLFLLVFYFGKFLHKHPYAFELGAFFVSILIYLFQPAMLNVNIPWIGTVISSGHLTLSFFLLVMFTGVLKKNSKAKKALSLVRAELAIIGFIFLLPHGLSRLDLALTGYNVTGLFAFILFLPLVITSFMFIRKKMNPKHWKQLHKLAYFAYFFIYFHMAFNFSIHPDYGFFMVDGEALLYHLVFIVYIALRVVFVVIPKVKKHKQSLNSSVA